MGQAGNPSGGLSMPRSTPWSKTLSSPARRPSRRLPSFRRWVHRLFEPLEARWLLASDSYVELNLAVNQPGTALVTDPSLAYAWGVSTSPGTSGGFSVSDTSLARANSYSGDVAGSPFAQNADQTVDVPQPTGQVYNGNPNEFVVHSQNPPPGGAAPITGGPAEFLYASLDGTIYGFNANIGSHAVPAVSVPGAVFTGLTIASSGTGASDGDQLYAADFLGGKIDVFDASFQPVTTSGSFIDPNLPAGYKPFNIEALGGNLYVTYTPSPVAANATDPRQLSAPGGVVDAYDAEGSFLGRIASGSPLDQPWGMAIAPQSFGPFAGDLLVANHGDGKINVFDPTPDATATTGTSLGTLSGADGNPFVIYGLWGLTFGNGDGAGDAGALYFTAGSLPIVAAPAGGPSIAFSFPSLLSRGLVGTIQVASTDPLVAVGTNATTEVGTKLSGAFAAFGSADLPSPLANPLPSYTATIDWGDGSSTSAGTVVPTGNGGFLVVGNHSYSAPGTDDYQVTIRDASGNTATATGTVQVTAADLVAHAVPMVSHQLAIDNAIVAGFVDAGGGDPLANYTATIDWGDGSTSAGTVSNADPTPTAVGFYNVAGSHTYTAAGDYTLTITINDTDGSQATVQGKAEVVQATLVAHALPVKSDGLVIDGAAVAAFSDTAGADPLSNYSATIDWGDGSTSAGTIGIGPLATDTATADKMVAANLFTVAGSHTYTATGDYTFTVTISDTDGIQTTAQGTIDAVPATLVAHAVPVKSDGLSVDATVASFLDTGGDDPLTNYTATIDWGDGSSSTGTVGSPPTPAAFGVGYFTVAATHTYAAAGDYTFTVTISDSDGSQATVQGTAVVAEPTLVAHAHPVISQGLTVDNATLADFSDTGGADPLSNYSATIDWGDGSSSTGTVTAAVAAAAAAGGLFGVAGSHTYTSAGDYTFSVTISDTDGDQTSVQGTAHVAQAPLLAVGVPVVVTSGLAVDGAIVAAFTDAGGGDSATNYSATIDWGDGSSATAGTVSGSGNSFIVTGSHAYAAAGDYHLKVSISDQDGSTAGAQSHAFIDSSVASFVASAFEDVLHRAADDTGLSYWTQQIGGGLASSQFASDLTHSAEYYATNVIDPDYQKFLGRNADPSGVAYWTGQMQQGLTDQQLEAEFIASPEFYAHAGGTNSSWVDAMYQMVLGRQADGGGLNYWLAQLSAGASRSGVALGFAASQEHDGQIVQNDYFTYLGRSAAASEVNYWVAQFENGATNEDVVSGFVGSSEYVKLHS
jgi:uncharacterized protein (TIGR03118 family)